MRLTAETLICVDFDDTLVTNQQHFAHALDDLAVLARQRLGVAEDVTRAAFAAVDRQYHHHGRHRNRFLLTVLAAYCAVAGSDAVPLDVVPALSAIAAHPYDATPEPKPGAWDALARLRAAHRGSLWLATSGDPVIQAGRVERSGLRSAFDAIHILPDKTPAAFHHLAAQVPHTERLMIGNAPRSDILPALAAGFRVCWVRQATWELDMAPVPSDVPTFDDFEAAVAWLLEGAPRQDRLPPDRMAQQGGVS